MKLHTLRAFCLMAAVAIALSACTKKSAREELLSRYDTISVSEGLRKAPPAVLEAINAYNAGDYFRSAVGFSGILKNEEYRALHESAEFYFAESLYRVGLFQPAQYELSKILFKGPEATKYFASALVRLLAITYETRDRTVIFAVLSNIPFNKFPKRFKNELLYMIGRMHFSRGDFDKAFETFDLVAPTSAFYAKANYFKGIILVKRRDYKEAKNTFDLIAGLPPTSIEFGESNKVKEMSKLALGQLYYKAGHEAREDKQVGIFSQAINYYNSVDRENVQWFEALFERTWAAFMIQRFNTALGTVLTLNSPFFADEFVPEVSLIESIVWYTLCKYPEVRGSLDAFFTTYEPMYDATKAFRFRIRGVDPEDVYRELVWQYHLARDGRPTRLPMPILTAVMTTNEFVNQYNHVQELKREIEIVESAPAFFRDSPAAKDMTGKMDTQMRNIRKKAGRYALDRLAEVETMLNGLLGNAAAIRFELTDSEKDRLAKVYAFGRDFQSRKAQEREAIFTPAVPDNYHYWPFDGEFWQDELGYYLYSEVQECE